jgi:hypothetical protein
VKLQPDLKLVANNVLFVKDVLVGTERLNVPDVRMSTTAVVGADGDTLNAFVRLDEGEPAEFLRFAQKFGVLTTVSGEHLNQFRNWSMGSASDRRMASQPVEDLAIWRDQARDARTLLADIAAVGGQRRRLGHWTPGGEALSTITDRVQHWLSAGAVVSGILASGDVRIQLQGEGLVGLLALELLAAGLAPEYVAVCKDCGYPYRARRKPTSSKDTFCDLHREKGRWREQKRRLRGSVSGPGAPGS